MIRQVECLSLVVSIGEVRFLSDRDRQLPGVKTLNPREHFRSYLM
jgi:hypothetical protein